MSHPRIRDPRKFLRETLCESHPRMLNAKTAQEMGNDQPAHQGNYRINYGTGIVLYGTASRLPGLAAQVRKSATDRKEKDPIMIPTER